MTRSALVNRGIVFLVGAGPGDPALMTRRGAEILERAEVVVYDGLMDPVLLDLTPATCERIYAGKKHAPSGPPHTQLQINELLVDRARAGKRVVRLKGGDPFVFGRGAEECRVLHEAGVPFEIVPGVTAATAVAAYAGIPLTARHAAATVAFATGHEAAGKPSSDVDWQALARAGTVVLFMAVRTAADCTSRLIGAGRDPETPAAAIYWGTTASQRTVVAPLAQLPEAMAKAGLKPPSLLVIGDVVALRPWLNWYERRPLFGVRVLILRNLLQASGFARAVTEYGAETVIMPVTRVVPPGTDEGAASAEMVRALPAYDWVALASANAVEHFFAALRARGLDARALAGVAIACVGSATARALAAHGLVPDLVPAITAERSAAAAMAAAICDQVGDRIAQTRILVPRAAEGRDEGIQALRAAGAHVDVVTVYRTVTTPADDPTLSHGLSRLQQGAIDVITFFAPSQVRAVFDIIAARSAADVDAKALIQDCRVVAAIGNTTRQALASRGIDVHLVASSPDADVFASELAAHYRDGAGPD